MCRHLVESWGYLDKRIKKFSPLSLNNICKTIITPILFLKNKQKKTYFSLIANSLPANSAENWGIIILCRFCGIHFAECVCRATVLKVSTLWSHKGQNVLLQISDWLLCCFPLLFHFQTCGNYSLVSWVQYGHKANLVLWNFIRWLNVRLRRLTLQGLIVYFFYMKADGSFFQTTHFFFCWSRQIPPNSLQLLSMFISLFLHLQWSDHEPHSIILSQISS